MKRIALIAALALALPAAAQEAPVTPASIVAGAPKADWTAIAPKDLLVMDLAPDRDGNPRRVVIQLMPAPFSQGWVANIRKLAAAHWWDGTSVYRVQDNYVVQWGDVTEEKALPEGLILVPENEYSVPLYEEFDALCPKQEVGRGLTICKATAIGFDPKKLTKAREISDDAYSSWGAFYEGWPLAGLDAFHYLDPKLAEKAPRSATWPAHCYGMVGVARNLSPDTGTGAELYTVIGHAPRQLDRNIALVGRIIEGMENLSSLPRGKGELGFYAENEIDKRVPILSVRLGDEIADLPRFEYLSTESGSFAAYAHARANRKDDFYIQPAGGVDICNVPVPIRRAQP